MNRRTLLASLLAAPMMAVAAKLCPAALVPVDEVWEVPQPGFDYVFSYDPTEVMQHVRVLGHYVMPDQPWDIKFVTKTRAELERDYP